MSFLAPAAFALAVLAGPLVALYMLRSRRLRVDVPSTMLWQDVGASVSSAIPWQRLKVTPLLILQLIALALLVVALARPFFAQETLLGPHTVLVVDTSGSMATGNRFDRAIARAMELSADVTESNLVSIVEAGPAPRVVLAFSRDADTVAAAL
ncbi:MAG: VWA domain-containing protein, partial [Acidimicrobiia bacterium]|nr:VWA domain-containing protein [Acidimicrobiia bacterium]